MGAFSLIVVINLLNRYHKMINLALVFFGENSERLGKGSCPKCCHGLGSSLYLLDNDTFFDMDCQKMSKISENCFPFEDVIMMRFSMLEDAVMMVLKSGEMMLTPTSIDDEIRPLGSFGSTLDVACLSPDESLLVAISESKFLTILDSNFDVVAE